ncbi:hypothetical protein NDU88_005567 [Pleurodeles waltl]|uniref:Uncharacterized protein n=1 Tax=Pleurodeles waltl TaxID=8319 RepID=A0AAV7PIX3_PLEWA|nr:hypothetical protein NDU88_005567 [Pleurodeles waltl]
MRRILLCCAGAGGPAAALQVAGRTLTARGPGQRSAPPPIQNGRRSTLRLPIREESSGWRLSPEWFSLQNSRPRTAEREMAFNEAWGNDDSWKARGGKEHLSGRRENTKLLARQSSERTVGSPM